MSEEGGVLSGPEIKNALKYGVIEIDPFDERNINPASIDLRLGSTVKVYEGWVNFGAAYRRQGQYFDGHDLVAVPQHVKNIKEQHSTRSWEMNADQGWVLKPGILYLMHTLERIRLERMVSVIDGKSSLGRLGIQVHITAGYFDPGWDGQGTLEVVVTSPVRVYPGMRFCQMRFHTLCGDMLSYQDTGHYKGKGAQGAVGSMAFTQFEE